MLPRCLDPSGVTMGVTAGVEQNGTQTGGGVYQNRSGGCPTPPIVFSPSLFGFFVLDRTTRTAPAERERTGATPPLSPLARHGQVGGSRSRLHVSVPEGSPARARAGRRAATRRLVLADRRRHVLVVRCGRHWPAVFPVDDPVAVLVHCRTPNLYRAVVAWQCVAPAAIASRRRARPRGIGKTESDHLPARPVKVGRPVVHEPPPPLEQVRPRVGGFDLVLNDMRQRRLDDLARVVGLLRRPVPERRAEAVWNAGDAAAFEQPAKLLGIQRHAAPVGEHQRTGVADHPRLAQDLDGPAAQGLDELVDRESAFLAELEDRQFLVGEVLRTSGDAEVSDGFQGGVQEKVKWGLFRSVKDYSIRNIV